MFGRIVRVVCTVALGYSLAILPALAADGKDGPSTKPPDWSHYTTVGNLVGEIVKADDKKLTLRVKWLQQQGSYRSGRGRGSAPARQGAAPRLRAPIRSRVARALQEAAAEARR